MKTLTLLVTLISLTACSVTSLKSVAGSSTLRVFIMSQCKATISAQNLSPIIAALIPSLIDSGVKSLSAAAVKAGQDSNGTVSGFNDAYFYKYDAAKKEITDHDNMKCLILVSDNGVTKNNISDRLKTAFTQAKLKNFLSTNKLPTYPSFYYEGEMEFSNKDKLFRVSNKAIYVM